MTANRLMLIPLLAAALTAAPASARDRGPLGDLDSYLRILSPKAELVARTAKVNEQVRQAERGRALRRSEAEGFYRRLDRVRDFLRDDRDLSRDEFKRRDGDLDGIQRDLDRKLDRRPRR